MTQQLCGKAAARCRCTKPAGHVEAGDPAHKCTDLCGGSWTGTHSGEDFKVVSYPSGIPEILIDSASEAFINLPPFPRVGITYPVEKEE